MNNKSLLAKAEELEFQMLDGFFFTEIIETPTHINAFHNKATDNYSNFAGRIRASDANAEKCLNEIKRFFKERNRKTSIVVSPFTQPSNFSSVLSNAGFQLAYKDVWMFYRGSKSDKQVFDQSISFSKVDDIKSLKTFVDTYNQAYSGTDPSEPYGQAPPEWGETFYTGFGHERPGRQVGYYIVYKDKQPASVLLTSCLDGFGGIYGVGTIPQMRGKGLGSALTLYAVNQLKKQGANEVFLQTEKGTYNEKFYEKLEFETEWETEAWHEM